MSYGRAFQYLGDITDKADNENEQNEQIMGINILGIKYNLPLRVLHYYNIKHLWNRMYNIYMYVSTLLRSINLHLHSFRIIRTSISSSVAITLASSVILPLFDYCHSTFFSLHYYNDYKYYSTIYSISNSIYGML